jgi:hypothetical protein
MVKQGSDSRIAHVGASFELNDVANEVVHRFARDGELQASCENTPGLQ